MSDTQARLKALGYPDRLDIARYVLENGPTSPRKTSLALELELNHTAYHFRVLAAAGLLRLAKTRQVRGSTEHFYEVDALEVEWVRALLEAEE